MAPVLQPGAQLDLTWRARLEDHIGTFSAELIRSRAASVMQDRMALAGFNAVTALLLFCLPEREAYARLYRMTEDLLDLLGEQTLWPLAYLRWELALLEEMGFGLDLGECAVLGPKANELSYISPRTGRAVSEQGAGEWADKLLPLPKCLLGEAPESDSEVLEALGVSGYFMANRLAPELGHNPIPEARARLGQRLEKTLSRYTSFQGVTFLG